MNELPRLIDDCARHGLAAELALHPKPGLVTPRSCGSHDDMNADHFSASIVALSGYFGDCARLGTAGAGLESLQARGIEAEHAMFAATGGINTHKGAIFTLGLLAAALGVQSRAGGRPDVGSLGRVVMRCWGDAILRSARHAPPDTHGARVRRHLGLPGAREQAAAGFPVLFKHTLPALSFARQRLDDAPDAALHALIVSIATLDDTNLAHRGGVAGLRWAQAAAKRFVARGSVFAPGASQAVSTLCADFEARRLSPGGSADLLASALMLVRLDTALRMRGSTPEPAVAT